MNWKEFFGDVDAFSRIDPALSETNMTVQYQGLLEKTVFSFMTTAPCCIFLYINVVMLYTLRTKSVFRETPRFILLYNLLFADTVQMTLSQCLYLLAASRIKLTYPVCGVLNLLSKITSVISPLTLVVMSLERYVAVCYPLRHTIIITIRRTGVAVAVVWAVSFLNVLVNIVLLLEFQFEDLQMREYCSDVSLYPGPQSVMYNQLFTSFLFVSASVVLTSSYVGVMVAARSASTNKTSAQKARNTLLLHLVQLGLSLCSFIYSPLLLSLSRTVTRIVLVRTQNVLYVCFIMLPRCLSSLTYGIRDQTIRLVLLSNLCCGLAH